MDQQDGSIKLILTKIEELAKISQWESVATIESNELAVIIIIAESSAFNNMFYPSIRVDKSTVVVVVWRV